MKLPAFILNFLKIKPEEDWKFSLLFLHSFFLGVFLAFQFIPSSSTFIHHWGSNTLPVAFIISGVVGYLISQIYSWFQKRINQNKLFAGAIIFMILITIFQRVGLHLFDEKWFSFFVFVWAWPFSTLAAMESGGLVLRLLDLRQSKRLFGLISIGSIIASILSYIIIPNITKFLSHAYDLLFIALFGAGMVLFFLFNIFKKFPVEKNQTTTKTEQTKELSLRELLKDKYFSYIFIVALLSTISIYFTEFGYLASLKVQKELIPTPKDLANFMSVVCAVFRTGELIISFFSGKIIVKRGVGFGLSILPFGLSIIILLATFSGILFAETSIVFFILMILNKITERSVRKGLDEPSFNILYQPLTGKQKLEIQTKTGIIIQTGAGVAGLLLFLITQLLQNNDGTFNLKYYTLFFLPVALLWAFTSRKLYFTYKAKIRQVLLELNRDKKEKEQGYLYGIEFLAKKIKKFNQKSVKTSISILTEVNPSKLEPYATSLLENEDIAIKESVLKNIHPLYPKKTEESVHKLASATQSASADLVNLVMRAKSVFEINTELQNIEIKQLVISENEAEAMQAVKLLAKNDYPDKEAYILQLLQNNNKAVKTAAFQIASKNPGENVIDAVIKLFVQPEYSYQAAYCLIDIGNKALPQLEKLFNETRDFSTLKRIIEILAKTGTAQAKSILVNKLEFKDFSIQTAIIKALCFTRYQAADKERLFVVNKFLNTMNEITWLMAVISDLHNERGILKLLQALETDKNINTELIFDLLSLMYDPKVIGLIKKNIIGANTIYALEIIDNFIDKDIKQYIIPLFDELPDTIKLKKLEQFFPQEKMNFKQRLCDLITQDYNRLSNWTVAKAIETLGKQYKRIQNQTINYNEKEIAEVNEWTRENIKKQMELIRHSNIPDEIFVCLYHPDELVYHTAAKIIFDENPLRCADSLKKLSPERQQLINILAEEKTENSNFLTTKVKHLRRIPSFFSISEIVLSKLAKIMDLKHFAKGEKIDLNHRASQTVILLIKGVITEKRLTGDTYHFQGDTIVFNSEFTELITKKDTLCFFVNRALYFNMLVEEDEILTGLFDITLRDSE